MCWHEDFPCPKYAHYGGWPCQKDGSTTHHWTLTYLVPPVDVLEIPNRIHDGDYDLQEWEPEAAATDMVYRQSLLRRIRQTVTRDISNSQLARRVDFWGLMVKDNCLCGLVVRVPGYRSRDAGFDSQLYQIFWEVVGLEWGPLSLVSTIEELLGRNSSGSGLENREYGHGDPLRWPRDTFYPQKLAQTSPTSGGRSVGTVRLRTKATEFFSMVKDSRTQSTVSGDGPGLPVLFAAQTARFLEFPIPPSYCFARHWFCMILGSKTTLHSYNWLGFNELQDTKRILFAWKRHVFTLLPPNGETGDEATAQATRRKLDLLFSLTCSRPCGRVCFWATDLRNPWGNYETLYSLVFLGIPSGSLLSFLLIFYNRPWSWNEWHPRFLKLSLELVSQNVLRLQCSNALF
jgi:hypothetical protein